jgi:AcrR family transcriptional regulator
MSLREIGKLRRRRRILDAAKRIIIAKGVERLSMTRLAREAELSVATLYNLYGSKEEILYALFDDCLDALDVAFDRLQRADPVARMRVVFTTSVDQLTREGTLYRPLMAAVSNQVDRTRVPRTIRRCEAMAEHALAAAMEQGILTPVLSPRALAHQIFMAYLQGMHGWAVGMLSDRGFRSQALHALFICLVAAATDSARPALLRELCRCEAGVRRIIVDLDRLGAGPGEGESSARKRVARA